MSARLHHLLWILDWSECSGLPKESSVLLEKAFQRTAAGSTVQPYRDLVGRSADGWLKNEEERPGSVVRLDGYQSRVHLANVKVDFG